MYVIPSEVAGAFDMPWSTSDATKNASAPAMGRTRTVLNRDFQLWDVRSLLRVWDKIEKTPPESEA